MMLVLPILLFTIIRSSNGYSSGAPLEACEDMKPDHPADPQPDGTFPYKISVSPNEIKSNEQADITISGQPFLGFLLQVRDDTNKPVGHFTIPDDHKYAKTLNCSNGDRTAATHKNATPKNDLTFKWTPPSDVDKIYKVYATVAENGNVYWVRRPGDSIKVT